MNFSNALVIAIAALSFLGMVALFFKMERDDFQLAPGFSVNGILAGTAMIPAVVLLKALTFVGVIDVTAVDTTLAFWLFIGGTIVGTFVFFAARPVLEWLDDRAAERPSEISSEV